MRMGGVRRVRVSIGELLVLLLLLRRRLLRVNVVGVVLLLLRLLLILKVGLVAGGVGGFVRLLGLWLGGQGGRLRGGFTVRVRLAWVLIRVTPSPSSPASSSTGTYPRHFPPGRPLLLLLFRWLLLLLLLLLVVELRVVRHAVGGRESRSRREASC
jgi:hypothetical protein